MTRTEQGFTLIELMIVIAIMGIVVTSIYPSLLTMIVQDRQQNAILHDAAGLTRLFGLFKTELKQPVTVVAADEKGVRFSDNRAIEVLNGGRAVKIGRSVIRLEGGARCWGFEKIDDRTFSSQIKNGPDRIRAIWRTGEL